MKNVRKLGRVIFYAVTLIVFGAGTVFTFLHRADFSKPITDKQNVLAFTGALFLTVGELALIYLHAMTDSKELWRRIAAYTLALGQICTITYAAGAEAKAYMDEGRAITKTTMLTENTKEMTAQLKTNRSKERTIAKSQDTLKQVLDDVQEADFSPFLINFIFGLFSVLTASLIQPREPWRRRAGNVMTPQIKAAAEKKIGFQIPDGAKAFDDGKGSSVIIKQGREYLGSISRKEIQ